MSYIQETGTSTDPFDLMDKFKIWFDTNATSWTVNKYSDVNAGNSRKGKHLSIQKGTAFFNLNSSDYKRPSLQSSTDTTEKTNDGTHENLSWFALNGSIGFDNAEFWNEQPGYFGGTSNAQSAGLGINDPYTHCVLVDDTSNNYWFFMSTDQNTFIIITEYRPNRFSTMVFGDFNDGTWTNNSLGHYCVSGIRCQYRLAGVGVMVNNDSEGSISVNSYYTGKNPFITESISHSNVTNNNFSIAYEVESGVNGLGVITKSPSQSTSTQKYVGSGINKSHVAEIPTMDFDNLVIHFSVNTFNGNSVLFPVEYYVETETKYHKVGQIPDIYLINMLNHDSKSTITIGSDNFLIIPMNQKETPQIYDKRRSFGFGLAIKI